MSAPFLLQLSSLSCVFQKKQEPIKLIPEALKAKTKKSAKGRLQFWSGGKIVSLISRSYCSSFNQFYKCLFSENLFFPIKSICCPRLYCICESGLNTNQNVHIPLHKI